MAKENPSNDNAHANEGKKDNTRKALSRDDEAKAETTRAAEKKTRSYSREARTEDGIGRRRGNAGTDARANA